MNTTTTAAHHPMEEEEEKEDTMEVDFPSTTTTTTTTTTMDTDWHDLSSKIRALMSFAAQVGASGGGVDGRNRYEDEMYVFVEGGSSDQPRKKIQLMWKSPGLLGAPWEKTALPDVVCQTDRRSHELLLQNALSAYSCVLRKQRGFWVCHVSTPPPLPPSSPAAEPPHVLLSRGRLVSLPL
jgi:hypothetical protein